MPVVAHRSLLLLIALTTGCATTSTKRIALDPVAVAAEEARQRQLVLADAMSQQRRLTNVAYPIVRAATTLCQDDVGRRSGMIVGNVWEYEGEWREAAAQVGLGDGLSVLAVAETSAAGRAGLRPGDQLLEVNRRPITPGRDAIDDYAGLVNEAVERGDRSYTVGFSREGERFEVVLELEEVCNYPVLVYSDPEPQALADGRRIFVSSGLMRFVDDKELSVVVSHEVAHNAMKHIGARRKNAILGAVLGAILDVAVGVESGYSTGGTYAIRGAEIGAGAFSQDFEIEADYVGMYALALAGLPLDDAPSVWRHMALANPKTIGFARTHPTTAERFLRLQIAADEIALKDQQGLALLPDARGVSDPARLGTYARAALGTDVEASAFVDPSDPQGDSRRESVASSADPTPPPNATPLRLAGPARDRDRRWGDRYWGLEGDAPTGRRATLPIGAEGVPFYDGWTRTLEWLGDGNQMTGTFTVGPGWRLVWRTDQRLPNLPFRIEVLSGESVVARVTQDGPSPEAAQLVLPEAGTYRLRIEGVGGTWYVGVEIPSPPPQ